MENRLVENGRTAVLYAPGYGAGWSTWNSGCEDGLEHFLLFDPTLVRMVLDDRREAIPSYVESIYPGAYTGAADQLQVMWISQGILFRVTEYDGAESIEEELSMEWKVA